MKFEKESNVVFIDSKWSTQWHYCNRHWKILLLCNKDYYTRRLLS